MIFDRKSLERDFKVLVVFYFFMGLLKSTVLVRSIFPGSEV